MTNAPALSPIDIVPLYLNPQIEENNRMGKTRDLFKKIRDIKGTLHAKMAKQKQKILRRGGKNTQMNYTKKIFITQIITMV